jgi:hypothetical protein
MPARFGDEGFHLGRSQAPGGLAVNEAFSARGPCIRLHGRRIAQAVSLVPSFVLYCCMRLELCMVSISEAGARPNGPTGYRLSPRRAERAGAGVPYAALEEREGCVMVSRQLELGFQNQPGLKPAGRSWGRSRRANWWFERMRGVVNDARDWPTGLPPARAPRPPAGRANSSPPPSGAASRASGSGLPTTEATAPPTSESRRWKFSRARRLTWE